MSAGVVDYRVGGPLAREAGSGPSETPVRAEDAPSSVSPTGAQILTSAEQVVSVVVAAGLTHAFMVPGETVLPLIDAFDAHPDVRLVTTRHEGGASFMAAAFARLTGRLTACLASRIPGASNLSIGLHTASVDSCPVLALVGQVGTGDRYRRAFQEVDLAQFLAPVTKWVAEPPAGSRLAELAHAAARHALCGRPGPTALVLQEDILDERVPASEHSGIDRPRPSASSEEVVAVLNRLRRADTPIVWVGGGVIDADAGHLVQSLAEHEEIPVMTAWRRLDAFPNSHRLYLGQSGLAVAPSVRDRMEHADFILAIGTQLGQLSTFHYKTLQQHTAIVHVSGHAEGLGGPFSGVKPILSDPHNFLTQLLDAAHREDPDPGLVKARVEENNTARKRWLAESTPTASGSHPGYVDQEVLAYHLRATIPADAVVTNDAGSFAAWISRYLTRDHSRTYLAPTSGAMGYAIPAALAAKLARPSVPAIAIVGDGGFMMTGAEIETAVRERLPVVVVVVDNGEYGTIRLHQERRRMGHFPGSLLGSIDFAAYGRSLGAEGFTVSADRDVRGVLNEALESTRPTVVHVRVDPAQLDIDARAEADGDR